jgi:hypothetical protein
VFGAIFCHIRGRRRRCLVERFGCGISEHSGSRGLQGSSPMTVKLEGEMSTKSAAKANLSLVEAVAEDPFYIPATALTSRPRRILKHGDSFVVLDSHGDIGATAGGTDGLFHCDTRFLSNLELRV